MVNIGGSAGLGKRTSARGGEIYIADQSRLHKPRYGIATSGLNLLNPADQQLEIGVVNRILKYEGLLSRSSRLFGILWDRKGRKVPATEGTL
jgi:hypothetical protein